MAGVRSIGRPSRWTSAPGGLDSKRTCAVVTAGAGETDAEVAALATGASVAGGLRPRAAKSPPAGPRADGDYAAVFTVAVNLPAALWRNLARYAGAHVYSETNDVLVADSSIVALHSLQSGKKKIALPAPFRVRDVVTGEDYARTPTNEITFDLKAPETRVFQLLH